MRCSRSSGLSLLELVIVVAILLLLMTLIIESIASARLQARQAITDRRIEDIRLKLSCLGQDGSGATYVIQKYWQDPVAPSPEFGIVRYDLNSVLARPDPVGGGIWLDLGPKWNLGVPWGRENRIGSAETDIDIPLIAFNARRTISLLVLIGVLPGNDPSTFDNETLSAYASRNREHAWNDAWGNPLVIGYALYQPSDADPIVAGMQVAEAHIQYQYERRMYVSVASAGPTLTFTPDFSNPAATDATIAAVWKQANEICQANPADTWVGSRFGNPPWHDIKHASGWQSGKFLRCSLSAPLDL
jgi:type II secretory pathway pseudopilin PulG